MPGTVLIGVDGSSRAEDAMAVAALLAPALEARPALLYAHPYRELESLLSEGEREQLVRDVVEKAARQARAYFGDAEAPRLELVGNRSPAAALHAAAAERDVAAIIIGSSSRGAIGRVMPGGTAQRLLSGAPCPIVVAPAGFAARQPLGLGAIGAGFDASAEASDALGFAARIASTNKSPLIVIAVHQRVAFGHLTVGAGQAVATVNEQLRADLSSDLDKIVDELATEQQVTGRFREGDPAAVLAKESENLGLLVVGSRGYGPIGSVLVGSVATRLLNSSSCPVMVVPRGA